MKATSAIKEIMKKKDIGITQLAKMTGRGPQVTYERLTQENISIVKLNEMLSVMGYKVLIVPDDTEVQDGWYKAE